MSELGHHGEWLSLIDISGPFLAEPVLKDAFPQGLDGLDSTKRRTARQAYDEWREALDLDDPDFLKIHRAWIDLVLKQVLDLDEDGSGVRAHKCARTRARRRGRRIRSSAGRSTG
jgi:hypothetical protein